MTKKTKRIKLAYGKYDTRYGYILSPIKDLPFMAAVPASIFPTKYEADIAAKFHGYDIVWDNSIPEYK